MTRKREKPILRPPLSKKLFPVGWVGKKTASQEVRIPNLIFFKLECIGGKVKKKIVFEKMKKKVPVGPFRPTRPVHRKQLFI